LRDACPNDFQSNLDQAAASRKNNNAISAMIRAAIAFLFNGFLHKKQRPRWFRDEIFAML
jgi:hypothetical protein